MDPSKTEKGEIRVMSIMAHQDDFEFNAGGTFALLRKSYGDRPRLHVLATTRGASGHHLMNAEETFRRRDAEARRSAATIGATYECLRLLDGSHPEGQVFPDRNFLGGLWNAIRRFQPDVIFAPPITKDPLAGVHIDHENTAHAVRMTAYQSAVPRAYPVMGEAVEGLLRKPLILVADDPYNRESSHHLCQDISAVFETKTAMGLCHESQILEWIPWINGEPGPVTPGQWIEKFRRRHILANERHGRPPEPFCEYFQLTRWGRGPREGELEALFPALLEKRLPA